MPISHSHCLVMNSSSGKNYRLLRFCDLRFLLVCGYAWKDTSLTMISRSSFMFFESTIIITRFFFLTSPKKITKTALHFHFFGLLSLHKNDRMYASFFMSRNPHNVARFHSSITSPWTVRYCCCSYWILVKIAQTMQKS